MANISKIKLPDGVTYNITDTTSGYTKNTGTVTGVKVGTTSYSPSSGIVSLPDYPTSLPASNTTSTYSSTGTAPVNGTAVAAALATLPAPMVFKGTVGTNGTITTLPVNGTATVGDTYKVITAGTYASQVAKVGDVFTCLTKTSSANTWAYIPSGDETDTDTWRNIKINGTEKLGSGISTGAVDFVNGTNTTVNWNATGNKISINATNTKYTATTTSIGSASAGTAIAADDITAWSAGTLPALTITSKSINIPQITEVQEMSVSEGVMTIESVGVMSASTSVGSASGWSAGTLPSLSYTARSIPNISVTSKTVATGISEA